MYRISVLTPTYNRCDLLPRLYGSLCRSTYKDFEWIIMDDGSTDDTKNVVRELSEKSPFPIRYYYQENSGKHVAVNKLYDLVESEYFITIDDDDELVTDAMEKVLNIWDSIPSEEIKDYWCVCGCCIDEKGNRVGNTFPDGINVVSAKKQKRMLKSCFGERCGCKRTEVLKKYKFPDIEGVKFVFEGFLWSEINKSYKQFYVNDILRVYHLPQTDKECLSNRRFDKSPARARSDYLLYKYILKECPNKYEYLSKGYLKAHYYLYQNSKIIKVRFSEVLDGMKFREKITLSVLALPITVYGKISGK